MRMNYWSLSKPIKKLRVKLGFPETPYAESAAGWNAFDKKCKEHSKILDYLTDDFVNTLQNIVYFPKDKIESFAYWFHNRFINPTWYINTHLDKNDWHETDEKIIHGLFEELVNFIECQKAWQNNNQYNKISNLPYFIRKILPYRDAKAGLEYLEWERKLHYDENCGVEKENEVYGQLTPQAIAAQEQLDLYNWWKITRANRPEPEDISGYSAYWDELSKLSPNNKSIFFDHDNEPAELREKGKEAMKQCYDIEESYQSEDEEMLIRLIKIRRSLWT